MIFYKDSIFKKKIFSRRKFLKYAGAVTTLFLRGGGIKNQLLSQIIPRPRVVSVYHSSATVYDYSTGYYWEHVDQNIVNDMITKGIKSLTGKANSVDAWNSLIPYQTGESIALKFNLNHSSCTKTNNLHDCLPQTANAIIDGLLSIGVPGNKIWITDPSRRVPEEFRNLIKNPDIQYFSYYPCSNGGPNYHSVPYVDPSSSAASVATCPAGEKILPSQVLVDAAHLINVPKLASHGSYITLALKNHYGSVIFENYDRPGMHAYFNQDQNIRGCDLNRTNILADINNNPHIRDKTRLIIGDGLFGNARANWLAPARWKIFENASPNIYFFSTDPIAISSVMADYIMAERGWQDHEQLHAGEYIGLGVHDHWDAFETKKYSLIDYEIIDLGNPVPVELGIFSADQVLNDIILKWITESEAKNYGFEIQRKCYSNKNEDWKSIGFIKGSGTSTAPVSYSFVDKNVKSGNFQYRLKQIDTDGKFTFYGPLNIIIEFPDKYILYPIYPNPFNPYTNISFYLPNQEMVNLEIFDANGRLVSCLVKQELCAGKHTYFWNSINRLGEEIASGNYFCKLTTNNYTNIRKMQKIK